MTLPEMLDFAIPSMVGLTCIAWSAGTSLPRRVVRVLALSALVGIAWFLLRTLPLAVLNMPEGRFDFSAFHEAGGEILRGLDPIIENRTKELPPLNPPTAFPLFAVLALLPLRESFAIWAVASAMMLAASGIVAWRLARRSRSEEFDDESVEVRRAGLAILVATLCLSNAARACLTSGQLGIAAAAAITGAIWARDRGRPILGALGFAVGSIKVGTVVPFALGLLRRGDLRLWLAAIGFSVLAVSFTEAPSEFASRARTWLETIGRLGAPGAVNDFARPGNDDMISLDRALFLAGLRDREQARFAQMLILGVIGATAAALVVRRRGELDARCWSLLAVFGSLFLYHRLTDMTILALPLATAMLESRRARGLRRGSMIILVILIITVLFMQRRLLVAVRAWADGRGDFRARLAEAVVLPHATWSLLLVFFLLALDLAFVGPSKTPATDHPPR